jgi:hypothetical protein
MAPVRTSPPRPRGLHTNDASERSGRQRGVQGPRADIDASERSIRATADVERGVPAPPERESMRPGGCRASLIELVLAQLYQPPSRHVAAVRLRLPIADRQYFPDCGGSECARAQVVRDELK